MLNLKKTAVAVLAFGSSAVFAGTMGPICAPGNVTVPCASTAWDFGVQALYLQPTYSGLGYIGSNSVTNATTGAVTESYIKAPQNWGWGFKLEGSYHFNTGNDLNLNWYYLDNTHEQNHAFGANTSIGPFNVTTGTTTATASNQVQWDAVNLEFGQHAHFGEFKNIRFHGGVQYAYIKNKQSINSTNVSAAVTPITSTATASDDVSYSGFGPRIGADYWYNWGNGFAMYAKGATTLLVGSQKFTDTYSAAALPFAIAKASTTGSTTAIVPQLEGKLGATYTYAMAQGDLSLDLGWMWVNYFNALSDGIRVATGSVGTLGGSTTESNFAVQGPFVGLKWVGNVA